MSAAKIMMQITGSLECTLSGKSYHSVIIRYLITGVIGQTALSDLTLNTLPDIFRPGEGGGVRIETRLEKAPLTGAISLNAFCG